MILVLEVFSWLFCILWDLVESQTHFIWVGGIFIINSGCYNKNAIHKVAFAKRHSSQEWRLGTPSLRNHLIYFLTWGLFLVCSRHLTLSSYGEERDHLICVSSKNTNLINEGAILMIQLPPKGPTPKIITSGVQASTYQFEGDTFCPQQGLKEIGV